jgi:hypothetical protein
VEETRLQCEHMADFRTVPVRHTFIMNDETVALCVVSFLRSGHF